MSAGNDDDRHEAAAEWLVRLQARAVSNLDLAAFAKWRRDPENEAAYRATEEVWSRSAELAADPDIDRYVREAIGSEPALGDVRNRRTPLLVLGTAAALICAALLLTLVLPVRSTPEYRTAIGERSDAVLADGSRVSIDTDTVLAADMSTTGRRVELRRGRAFFDVKHDARRPFVVQAAGGLTVTAIGTRFDVRTLDGAVRVALEQGSVELRHDGRLLARLSPGQAVEVSASGRMRGLAEPVGQMMSWRRSRLVFRSTPLAEAVAEMNRYTTNRIVVTDGAERSSSVSGEFSVDDTAGFAIAVNAVFGAGTVNRRAPAYDGR